MTEGTVISGRYELGGRLGLGGMSTVHDAFDRRLERHVAVKLLAEHLVDDHQFVTRFRREALAAARLVHPNVVQVFDFGLDETSGRHYIVMERIDGPSCAQLLREAPDGLPLSEVLDIVTQSCRGLDYAHRNGVVHRDVKPGNLLRAHDGTIKLADFGIAKAVSEESSITQVGSVLGTAAYLAPEQAAGEEVGPKADLYALGVVSYQMLTGRLPYEAQSLTELALKQQRERPPMLDQIVPGVGRPVAEVVDRALALDPRHRWETADELRSALRQAGAGVAPKRQTLGGDGVTEDPDRTTVQPAATGITDAFEAPAVAPVRAREPRAPRQPTSSRPPVQAYEPGAGGDDIAAEKPRKKGRVRKAFGTLMILLLLAAGGAIAYISTSNSDDAIKLRNVTYDNAEQVLDEVIQLVRDNTQ